MSARPHPLLGRRLLIITAHPDDEAFLCSGTTMQNFKAGGTNALICATLGEKGTSHMRQPVTERQLTIIRRRELMAGAALAKIKPISMLRLPDGSLPRLFSKFLRSVRTIARRWRPEVILTFGRDGLTGHICHVACWRAGRILANELQLPLYVFTVPPKLRKRAARWFTARRVSPHYHSHIPLYRQPTLRVPTPPGFKRRVLRHYRSQLLGHNPYRDFPKYAVKMFTAAEYFCRESM